MNDGLSKASRSNISAESLWKLTVAGFLIVFSFTFFFVTQSNPSLIPWFYTVFSNRFVLQSDRSSNNVTHPITNNTKVAAIESKTNTNYFEFIGLEKVRNPTQWQSAFERVMGDYILPLQPFFLVYKEKGLSL